MATRLLQFPLSSDAFGVCPLCRRSSGYLNVGSEHWFFCRRHKTKWLGGTDLLSSWHSETELDWMRNAVRLSAFVEVDGTWALNHANGTTTS